MANLVFIEAGSDATGGTHFYTSTGGTAPTSSTTVSKTGPRSIRCTGNGPSFVKKLSVCADAGRRIQKHIRFTSLPANSYVPIMEVTDNKGSEVYSVRLGSNGKLQLFANGVVIGTGTTVLTINTWYRITLSYTITSTAVNSAKVWQEGTLEITASNKTLGVTGSADLSLGWISDPGLTITDYLYFDNVYVDDGSAVDDPGAIFVTAKKPAANNVNNFNTAVGANPANRWTNVNEVPLSIVNGWAETTTSVITENYTLEAAAVGDVDVSAATIIGRSAWVYAKRGEVASRFIQKAAKAASTTPGPSLVVNSSGVDTTAGNTIVIAFAMDNDTPGSGGIITVTDSAGNSYTEAVQVSQGSQVAKGVRTAIFYCQNASSVLSNGKWTISHPAVQNRAAIVMEFSGISSSPVDLAIGRADSTTTPSSGVSGTPSQSAEIIVGAIGFRNFQSDFRSVGTGMTPDQQHVDVISSSNGTDSISIEAQFTIQTATNAQEANATLYTSDPVAVCLASFKSDGTTVGSPKITDNNSDTILTLTTTPDLYTVLTTSASYPSNVAGIGMKSSGATPDTYLYECGTLLAYS